MNNNTHIYPNHSKHVGGYNYRDHGEKNNRNMK